MDNGNFGWHKAREQGFELGKSKRNGIHSAHVYHYTIHCQTFRFLSKNLWFAWHLVSAVWRVERAAILYLTTQRYWMELYRTETCEMPNKLQVFVFEMAHKPHSMQAESYYEISRHGTNYTHTYRCRAIGRRARIVKCTASTRNNVYVVSVPDSVRPAHQFTEAMSMSNRLETMFCDERLLKQRYRCWSFHLCLSRRRRRHHVSVDKISTWKRQQRALAMETLWWVRYKSFYFSNSQNENDINGGDIGLCVLQRIRRTISANTNNHLQFISSKHQGERHRDY